MLTQLSVSTAVIFQQKDDKRVPTVAFKTSSVSELGVFCLPSRSTFKHSPPCLLPWSLGQQQVPCFLASGRVCQWGALAENARKMENGVRYLFP